ncbi:hypothetical protein ACIBCR_19955 [Micromonospora echinospora]|uniref:hypothetical protein n=1 Tax=Micromonospora echinospora TaxID=1877 RepID=UPI00378887F4
MPFRFRQSLVMTAMAVTLVTALTAAPATAAPTADPTVAAALQRIAANSYSAADIALVQSQPDIARVVADPGRTTITRSTSPNLAGLFGGGTTAPKRAVTPLAETCGWVEVTITVYTVLGFDLFKWTHHAGACHNGINITRWTERYDRMDYADLTVYVRDLVINSAGGTPAAQTASTMQRHLEQCVIKYGCYANWYPWSTIYLFGNGTYDYRWGVG